ncbi:MULTISPECIES: hypothetical protein [unclassified Streptomyces]|uniref:hypothetical protein n=1 Tax=unclassified Streptomyces TaxID=2593676 RepID=UPI0033BAE231
MSVPPTSEVGLRSPGQVVDLMAALEQSVAEARATRGKVEGSVHEMPAKTAKKTAGKTVPR